MREPDPEGDLWAGTSKCCPGGGCMGSEREIEFLRKKGGGGGLAVKKRDGKKKD